MHQTAPTRRRVRGAGLAVLPAILLSAALASAGDLSTVHRFEIPAQSLDTALLAFSDQTKVQVIMWAQERSTAKSAGVSGNLIAGDALKAILEGTGLRFQQVDATTVAILRLPAPVPESTLRGARGESVRTARAEARNTDAPGPASRHVAKGGDDPNPGLEELVVTGSLLRGAAPAGTNLVSMSNFAIAESGATNTNQVLSRIPQISSAFNQVPTLPTTNPGMAIVFPNIRNLPAGGATTLVLLDGHRVGASGGFAAVDPDVFPPSVIQLVDVIPDGGSSVYGSDAVGGVINFITRKRVNGVEFNGKYGFGDAYHALDTSILAGGEWIDGSGYISYSYTQSEEVLGRDRDYYRQLTPNNGFCAPGTVAINRGGVSTTYALPPRIPGTVSSCDNTDNLTVFPGIERHSMFSSLTHSIADTVEFGVTAFYTRRTATSRDDLNRPGENGAQTGIITATNPWYVPIIPDVGSQTVSFSYAGVIDNESTNELAQSSVTPTLTADLWGDWQLRALATYGHSRILYSSPTIDAKAQAAALAASTPEEALNPYDVAASNPAVVRNIVIPGTSRQAQTYNNARAIIDGSLWSLPGGDVRFAAGLEYGREEMRNRLTGTFVAAAEASRNVTSAFSEVAVAIVGDSNAVPGIEKLTLSLSARYDNYSDIGDSVNPKLGVTYNPVEWAAFRANWGKSFSAPGLGDTGAAADTRAVLLPLTPSFFVDPTDDANGVLQRPLAILAGGNERLKPQKATTWSIGFDLTPLSLPELTLSATYYNIEMANQIAMVPIFTAAQAYRSVYSPWVVKNPTLEQARQMIGDLRLLNAASIEEWYNDPDGMPYAILDARRQNLGTVKQDGIDFNLKYTQPTGFGSISAGIGGTYTLSRDIAAIAGDPFSNNLATPGTSRYNLLASLGATIGDFDVSATLMQTAGYDIEPALRTQGHVSSFNTVDLFFGYDIQHAGAQKNVALTLNISNVFDEDPPFYNQDPGYNLAAHSTLGRLISLGISKRL